MLALTRKTPTFAMSGVADHPGQGRVLLLVKELPQNGRSLGLAYSWKDKLAEVEGECSKALPGSTIAQT